MIDHQETKCRKLKVLESAEARAAAKCNAFCVARTFPTKEKYSNNPCIGRINRSQSSQCKNNHDGNFINNHFADDKTKLPDDLLYAIRTKIVAINDAIFLEYVKELIPQTLMQTFLNTLW